MDDSLMNAIELAAARLEPGTPIRLRHNYGGDYPEVGTFEGLFVVMGGGLGLHFGYESTRDGRKIRGKVGVHGTSVLWLEVLAPAGDDRNMPPEGGK